MSVLIIMYVISSFIFLQILITGAFFLENSFMHPALSLLFLFVLVSLFFFHEAFTPTFQDLVTVRNSHDDLIVWCLHLPCA